MLREETDIIREAVNRLPDNEGYERVYRMKVAFQYSLSHTIATKGATLKPEDDIRYLTPIIDEVAAEFAEKEDFNVGVFFLFFCRLSDCVFLILLVVVGSGGGVMREDET